MSTIQSGVSKTATVRSAAQKSLNQKPGGENASAPDGAEQDTIVKNWRNQSARNSSMPDLHDDHYHDSRNMDQCNHQA